MAAHSASLAYLFDLCDLGSHILGSASCPGHVNCQTNPKKHITESLLLKRSLSSTNAQCEHKQQNSVLTTGAK